MRYREVVTLLIAVVSIATYGCREQRGVVTDDSYFKISEDNITINIERSNFSLSIVDSSGDTIVEPSSGGGIDIDGASIEGVELISTALDDTIAIYQLSASTAKGDKVDIALSIYNSTVKIDVDTELDRAAISLNMGGADLAHGLGDAAAFEESFNIVDNKKEIYPVVNNGGSKRWLSTFVIFPNRRFAGVFFDEGERSVTLSREHYSMNIKGVNRVSFYLITGNTKEIYRKYRDVRTSLGFSDVKPKFRLFELGWESWDALGWNTNEESVKSILAKFHQNNYPIRWAVTGSGFWETGGTTTSFGKWGDKFPDPKAFKNWMHSSDIYWMIGLRTNLTPEGGPFYPITKRRDKNLKVKAFNGSTVTSEAAERGYLLKESNSIGLKSQNINNYIDKDSIYTDSRYSDNLLITSTIFPIVACNILDGTVLGAAQWYQEHYSEWGVDGVKEDTMMDMKYKTSIFNAPISELSDKGALVMARCGNFSSPGTLLRVNDTGVGNMVKRTPINYMQYAASGASNVYSDVVGVHNMNSIDGIEANIRHSWLLSLTAGMAVGAYPSKWSEEQRDILKKSIDTHYKLAPYIYSAAIKSYRSGFPYTLTPISIAYPNSMEAADAGNFEWLIGESILATPLLKNYKSGVMDIYLPEGIWFDYETGREYIGGTTLKEFIMPLDKTPIFIGGKGVIVEREGDRLYAVIYPTKIRSTYLFTHPDGESTSTIEVKSSTIKRATVLNSTTGKEVSTKREGPTIRFAIEGGSSYSIE